MRTGHWHTTGFMKTMGRTRPNTRSETVSTNRNTARDPLWSFIYQAGLEHLESFIKELAVAAPLPGSLVFLQASSSLDSSNGFSPGLLSAIDARTHLQVSRLYMAASSGAGLDFADYLLATLPFPVREIRTVVHPIFAHPSIHQGEHRFTAALKARGVLHAIIPSRGDPLLNHLRQYFFARPLPEALQEGSVNDYLRELRNYLYFHNNHRSFPLLNGRTPVQVLGTIDGFASPVAFDPFGKLPVLPAPSA